MGVIATETWEWVIFGMPWQVAAAVIGFGLVALGLASRGDD